MHLIPCPECGKKPKLMYDFSNLFFERMFSLGTFRLIKHHKYYQCTNSDCQPVGIRLGSKNYKFFWNKAILENRYRIHMSQRDENLLKKWLIFGELCGPYLADILIKWGKYHCYPWKDYGNKLIDSKDIKPSLVTRDFEAAIKFIIDYHKAK